MGEEPRAAIDVRSWVRSERRIAVQPPRRAVVASVLAAVALVVGLVLALADPFADVPTASRALPAGVPAPRLTPPPTTASSPPPSPRSVSTRPQSSASSMPVPQESSALGSAPAITPIPPWENPFAGLAAQVRSGGRTSVREGSGLGEVVRVAVPCVVSELQGCRAPTTPSSPFPGTGRAVGAVLASGALALAWRARRAVAWA